MGYDSILRKGVALLDQQTKSLQDQVDFYAWDGIDTYGSPTYAAPITMKAIVEENQYKRRLPDGSEVTQKAIITIPRPIKPNGAVGRFEPVDPRDKFVLPSGFTGPILYVNGVMDPTTNAPYSYEIVLG